jgi:hypothetical protein
VRDALVHGGERGTVEEIREGDAVARCPQTIGERVNTGGESLRVVSTPRRKYEGRSFGLVDAGLCCLGQPKLDTAEPR